MSAPTPSGPFAALVHVILRRPVIAPLIAVVGITGALSVVDSGPLGPGIHGGSEGVMADVVERMAEDDPTLLERLDQYEDTFELAMLRRTEPLNDEQIEFVLDAYKSTGLSVDDVRNNEDLELAITKAYFYNLVFDSGGDVRAASERFIEVH